jgi:hypothetical protein
MSLDADHIPEKRSALARLNGVSGADPRHFQLFFAALTAHGEREGSQSSFPDLACARKARVVPARPEPDERFADPGQRLCALEQRALDVPLDVGVRDVDVIADVVAPIDSPTRIRFCTSSCSSRRRSISICLKSVLRVRGS